ncbi:ATP-binding protein [Candidatus Woesearchaeota archaeon]|nr:MAG: ATP-binding protein [Candidatus Woesearchaeota archaeon]
MLLGTIKGKTTTTHFSFEANQHAKKFDYVQVYHPPYDYVLALITELERSENTTTATCHVIGFRDKDGTIRQPRSPFKPGTEVLRAEDDLITHIIQLPDKKSAAYIGKLEGKNIDVHLDLHKLLTKHVSILAKSGAGKSYTVGVLIEEILEKKVPVIILDPHGEYATLSKRNVEEQERLARFNLKPSSYPVTIYTDPASGQGTPLKLPNTFTQEELIHLFPGKLNSTQLGILYSAIKSVEKLNFTNIILSLEQDESNAKWSIIRTLEYLNNLHIFSENAPPYQTYLAPGEATIFNLKGTPPDIQELIAYKLIKDLFELRKKNKIPPFFLVVEEAHNFCPERNFGEAKSSKILRTVASEGRKFGLGLCIVSQRPARVDKSVLSQCTTQIILKVTNPNDLRAISSGVEGLSAEAEKEITNLTIGSALITGVTDLPLFTTIRPRKSAHGGTAVNILNNEEHDFLDQLEAFKEEEILPLIKPDVTLKDVILMQEEEADVRVVLHPVLRVLCSDKDGDYPLIFSLTNGALITDINQFTTKFLPNLHNLPKESLMLLQAAFSLKHFTRSQLAKHIGATTIDAPLNALLKHGLLTKENNHFSLSPQHVFTRLHKCAIFTPIAYEKIAYHTKEESTTTPEHIITSLERFTNVKEHQTCYAVRYQTIKRKTQSKQQSKHEQKKKPAEEKRNS